MLIKELGTLKDEVNRYKSKITTRVLPAKNRRSRIYRRLNSRAGRFAGRGGIMLFEEFNDELIPDNFRFLSVRWPVK
ncbi:MAG: hypothetical protein CVU54_12220 [Deltaproteobacteria bacterium HGW-Deltaproteobacteria-12]|nr:MAG: hypothetical protein CVU54_12220 [Deltaproteobacteria bacterium HGW-Deltaproteobacteria-12]